MATSSEININLSNVEKQDMNILNDNKDNPGQINTRISVSLQHSVKIIGWEVQNLEKSLSCILYMNLQPAGLVVMFFGGIWGIVIQKKRVSFFSCETGIYREVFQTE